MIQYSNMSREELEEEIRRLEMEESRARRSAMPGEEAVIRQKINFAKSYLTDPDTIRPGDRFAVEGDSRLFEVEYLRGVMAWGRWQDEQVLSALPIGILIPAPLMIEFVPGGRMMSDWNLTDAYGEQKSEIISLELESRLYEHLLQDRDFTSQIQGLRKEVFHRLGVYLPSIRIRTLSSMDRGCYRIRVRGRCAAEGVLNPPLRFSDQPGEEEETPAIHPLQRTEGWWTEGDGESCAEIIIRHVRSVLNRRLDDLVTFDWVTRWLKQARSHNPELVKELESRRLTPGLLWSVMKQLAKERILSLPLRNCWKSSWNITSPIPMRGTLPRSGTNPIRQRSPNMWPPKTRTAAAAAPPNRKARSSAFQSNSFPSRREAVVFL